MTCRLDAENLGITFGGLVAVKGLNLTVSSGQVVGLIGPNGAGKTTAFNLMSGVYRPTSGAVKLDGRDLVGTRPWQFTRAGIARTFQTIRLFRNLSVLDNVLAGLHLHGTSGILGAALQTRAHREEARRLRERAVQLLEQAGLAERAREKAGALAYGEQRRLEIARALATEPKILLLDEPKAGMNPEETRRVMAYARSLVGGGLGILVIEHDMRMIMNLCHRITVLHHGEPIAEGTAAEIQRDARVVAAYLGGRHRRHA